MKCAYCNAELEREVVFSCNGVDMCAVCFEEHTVVCSSCNEIILRRDANQANGVYYCNDCFDDLDSEEDEENAIIHDYYYKPCPIFYGATDKTNLFLGVELEIDGAGESDDNAECLLDVGNRCREHLYIKHDGSIYEGFELVTHPMTLDYHMQQMPWPELLQEAMKMGYKSHQTSTCGLHVHVNRLAFGKTKAQQEEVIGRVVYFVENHWDKLLKFSRRTPENMERWANRYGIAQTAKETYKSAKDKNKTQRYVAVNLENYATIEFRIFRGTLRLPTLLATLQLVDAICRTCMELDDEALETLTWEDFVRRIHHGELLDYLKSKRLDAKGVA